MVALAGKHGVVTAIDKIVASKCYVEVRREITWVLVSECVMSPIAKR